MTWECVCEGKWGTGRSTIPSPPLHQHLPLQHHLPLQPQLARQPRGARGNRSGSLLRAPARILSWNVNGLRACARKGFEGWLARCRAEILGLQEVRALPEELPEGLQEPKHWHVRYTPAERRGYSGVGLLSRREPDALHTSLGEARFDAEGRLQIARFGRLAVANRSRRRTASTPA